MDVVDHAQQLRVNDIGLFWAPMVRRPKQNFHTQTNEQTNKQTHKQTNEQTNKHIKLIKLEKSRRVLRSTKTRRCRNKNRKKTGDRSGVGEGETTAVFMVGGMAR